MIGPHSFDGVLELPETIYSIIKIVLGGVIFAALCFEIHKTVRGPQKGDR